MKWFNSKINKWKILILSEIFLLLSLGTIAVFAAVTTTVGSSSGSMNRLDVDAQDQFLEVKSSNPITGTPSDPNPDDPGNIAVDIYCPDKQQQLIGIIEKNVGGTPYDPNEPRNFQWIGSYKYIPRCTDVNWGTFECDETDWVSQYDKRDVLTAVCTTNALKWEKINTNANLPSTTNTPIGSYVPASASPTP